MARAVEAVEAVEVVEVVEAASVAVASALLAGAPLMGHSRRRRERRFWLGCSSHPRPSTPPPLEVGDGARELGSDGVQLLVFL